MCIQEDDGRRVRERVDTAVVARTLPTAAAAASSDRVVVVVPGDFAPVESLSPSCILKLPLSARSVSNRDANHRSACTDNFSSES